MISIDITKLGDEIRRQLQAEEMLVRLTDFNQAIQNRSTILKSDQASQNRPNVLKSSPNFQNMPNPRKNSP